jgi:hypothetical protein
VRAGYVEADGGGCSEQGRAAVGGSGSVVVVGPVEDRGALSIPPDLKDSGVNAIFSGRFPSPAAAHLPAKVYGIRMAGVFPDTGVGSLIAQC